MEIAWCPTSREHYNIVSLQEIGSSPNQSHESCGFLLAEQH